MGGDPKETEPQHVLVIGDGPTANEVRTQIERSGLPVRHLPELPASLSNGPRTDLVVLAPGPRSFPPCRQIKESQGRFLPVMVVLTPHATISRAEVLQAGADDVLTGLPDPEEFRLRVLNWLRIKSTHDNLLHASPRADDTLPPPARSAASANPPASATRVTMHGLIETRLRVEHARALRHRESLAFAYFSVDDAKHMLRRFGNRAIDRIAQEITERMEECFREGDQVCRIDTLGFGVILPHAHFEGALAVTARAHKRMTGIYEVDKQPTRVSASVGVSLFPSPRVNSYRELGTVAQIGASEALAAGGNRICVVQHAGYMFEPDT